MYLNEDRKQAQRLELILLCVKLFIYFFTLFFQGLALEDRTSTSTVIKEPSRTTTLIDLLNAEVKKIKIMWNLSELLNLLVAEQDEGLCLLSLGHCCKLFVLKLL